MVHVVMSGKFRNQRVDACECGWVWEWDGVGGEWRQWGVASVCLRIQSVVHIVVRSQRIGACSWVRLHSGAIVQ